MNHGKRETGAITGEPPVRDPMLEISERVAACMQCGSCTGSCANSEAMDLTPRQLWRLVQLNAGEEIFGSRTFWLCSSCYYCTLRCPRGLPLTETIEALKRLSVAEGFGQHRKNSLFYLTFLDSIRRYGRVREMEMMARYFLSLKNPVTPLSFTPLGIKLMVKGKLSAHLPSFSRKGRLDDLYHRVRELEANS